MSDDAQSSQPGEGRGRLRVALIFGGRSAEHEVSCVSAASVVEALDPGRYEIVPIGIDKQGRWHLLQGPPALESGATELPSVRPESGSEIALSQDPGSRELVGQDGRRETVDVAFPILHGPFGEDGTIQGLLELAGMPYVGAGVMASAVGMDKAVQKVLFRAAGLSIVPHEVVLEREWREDPESVEARAEALGFPLFVKPATLGSSVGVTKVKTLADLESAVEEALRYTRKALVEQAMEGAREIECAVLGNDDPVASVPGEILPAGEFYDYRSKYLDDSTRLEVPARLSSEIAEEVQRMSVTAFRAIDCMGMARVDFFLIEPEHLIVNEINTIPGFTSVSMYPRMWKASGLSYPELVDRLIQLAVERHDAEAKRGRTLEELPPPG
ncbi:MAG TPA: D-alanine--D-alanine ligase family protein [Actinomycetota bacterium]|nr:D-alanine--D-alanine ligase family protein [Actinomycetota bacterium]